jgi:uncharacterized membrane protein
MKGMQGINFKKAFVLYFESTLVSALIPGIPFIPVNLMSFASK